MSKIIQVINSMILNKKLIDVKVTDNINYYFTYNENYKWCIWRYHQGSGINLTFYPIGAEVTMEVLYNDIQFDNNTIQKITYTSDDYKNKEAIETFQDLYKIIQEKALGVDGIFDDLLKLE